MIKRQHTTRGIKNCRLSKLFKGCSSLQLSCNLTGKNRPQTATFHTTIVSGKANKMTMRVIILFILTIIPVKGLSCMCAFQSFKSACESSPYIFEGRIIDQINDRQCNPYYPLKLYKVVVLDIWKGTLNDTIDLYTGIGGGDCGIILEIGKTYLIWTSRQYGEIVSTNFCTRTNLIDMTPDIDLLNYKFKNKGYDLMYLTKKELRIITNRISNDSIDLTKVSLFLEDNKLLSKEELVDALYKGGRVDLFIVPPTKRKFLPVNAHYGVLVFHDRDKKIRKNKIIKTLKKPSH